MNQSRHVSGPDSSTSGMGPRTASSAALQTPSIYQGNPKHNNNNNDNNYINNSNNDNNDLQAFQLILLANPKHDLYEIVLMMTDMLAARTTGATESAQNQYCPWDVSTYPHNSP